MVLLPVIYDVGLYLVMKKEFLIWHGLRAIAITFMALSAMNVALPASMDHERVRWIIQILATDLSIAVSGPFLAAYVEKNMLSNRLVAALRATMPVVLISSILLIGFGSAPVLSYTRNAVFLVVLILLIYALARALVRGSRAARYQATAWSAVFGVCGYALFHELVLLKGMDNWMEAILAAIAVEIVVTAAGIADRFMVLKRERDDALTREREAQDAAITDPLTCLRNRRGLGIRYAAKDRDVITGLAIIDVDHFKRINDTYGHDVGDEVLIAVARALSGRNRFAARLGGEEFAVFLFGADWLAEAEAARTAVEHYVHMEVEPVGFAVTASAGVVRVLPADSLTELLKAADRALYAAKNSGRNQCSFAHRTEMTREEAKEAA